MMLSCQTLSYFFFSHASQLVESTLVPGPGIELGPPAVESESLDLQGSPNPFLLKFKIMYL